MPTLLDTPIRTTAHDLDAALATRHPVLLVFEAPQAEPCRALEPLVEDLAQAYVDRLRVIRVVDAREDDMALRFDITHVPTLLFRRQGREVARIEGAADARALERHVSYLLGEAVRPEPAAGPRVALRRAGAESPRLPADAPSIPLEAGDATFDGLVLGSPVPALVHFWAAWASACRTTAPIVDELARDYAGQVRVVTVDADSSPGSVSRYGILGLPTLILFRDGHPLFRASGAVSKAALIHAVDAAVGSR